MDPSRRMLIVLLTASSIDNSATCVMPLKESKVGQLSIDHISTGKRLRIDNGREENLSCSTFCGPLIKRFVLGSSDRRQVEHLSGGASVERLNLLAISRSIIRCIAMVYIYAYQVPILLLEFGIVE